MSVTRDQIDALCAALPGATQAHPPELVSWKVGGKMFACFGGDGEMTGVSIKTPSTDHAELLIAAKIARKAPYFHNSWVRFDFATADLDEVTANLHRSYDLIRKGLKKPQRDALAPRKDS